MTKSPKRYIGIGASLVFSALVSLTSCGDRNPVSPLSEQTAEQIDESIEYNFPPQEACTLKIYGIAPDAANIYRGLTRKADDVIAFSQAGISPETAREYDSSRFNGKSIVVLHQAGISASEADLYDLDFAEDNVYGSNGLLVKRICQANCGPITAESYKMFRNASDVVDLAENRVDPEFANRLDERFDKNSIITLWKNDAGWQWGRANSYSDSFTDEDVVLLYGHVEPTNANIFAAIASRFGAHIDAAEILRFVKLGIYEEEFEKIAREEMIRRDIRD